MTSLPFFPSTRRKGFASLLPLAGALLALPALLLGTRALADQERGMPAQDRGAAVSAPVSAPAPAPSFEPASARSEPAPSFAPAPSFEPASARSAPAPSFAPAPPRSAPSSGPTSSSRPSASAPSRGPATSGHGVQRGTPSRGGSRDSAIRPTYGSGGRHGYVTAGPRGGHPGGVYRPHRRYHGPSWGWSGTSWWWGGPWDWWWWGSGWWDPYWGWGGVTVIDDDEALPDRYARVDTDVSPETAEVYLDGTYIGSADDFDGYPGYLYLEPGKYRLEFRHPGYETLVKELEVRVGQQVRFNDEMKLLPGQNRLSLTDPEDRGTPLGRIFGKPDKDRADRGRDRTGRYEPKGRAVPRHEATMEEPDDVDEPDEVDLEDEDAAEAAPPSERPEPSVVAPKPPADEKAVVERGRLRFDVTPDDAAIYLDDRYVGTGEELAGLRRGFPVAAGKHTVTVVRPGYAARTTDVEAKPGKAIDVVIELDK